MPKHENRLAAPYAVLIVTLVQACEAPADVRESELLTSAVSLDGLRSDELARFQVGVGEFGEIESVAEGLGPFFNASSCGHCHAGAGLGSGGVTRVTRVMCQSSEGELESPPAGQLLHAFSTRPDVAGPGIPKSCNAVVADRRTTNVLGAGLIEAIADEEILAEEAAQRGGPSGRAALVDDAFRGGQRVGRFGWKAQHATLDAFAADAYRNEMGITNEIFTDDVAPEGDPDLLAAMDTVPDPEAPVGAVAALSDFMRFSAPLAPTGDEPAGLETFRRIGCVTCHRETYQTRDGASGVASRDVRLFSDLLLHDIGTGDGIPQGAALENEIRTPPLWGLGRASFYLHDGGAVSIDEAVLAHAGQAADVTLAYAALTESERLELLAFLEAL